MKMNVKSKEIGDTLLPMHIPVSLPVPAYPVFRLP